MRSIIKLLKLATSHLNNFEFVAFMGKVLVLIIKATIAKLGIDSETFTRFKELLQQLTDLITRQLSSDYTVLLHGLDVKRDNLLKLLRNRVRDSLVADVEGYQEAAYKLWLLIKHYGNLARMSREQETAGIEALLFDFEKPEYAPHIITLGLPPVINELNSANASYKELSLRRTEDRAADTLETARELRLQINEVYDRILSLAFIASGSTPSDEADEFVASYNQLVAETKTAYKQRMSLHKGGQQQGGKTTN